MIVYPIHVHLKPFKHKYQKHFLIIDPTNAYISFVLLKFSHGFAVSKIIQMNEQSY
jgi:hypothetical protein